MEIERINENTLKFYISYQDIEERGFNREDIWYNREKGEQLFWEMMDEVNDEEDFSIDGPLWIQVQALDKGLEIVVTKAQVSKDGEKLEFPHEEMNPLQTNLDEKLESLMDHNSQRRKSKKSYKPEQEASEEQQDDHLDLMVTFRDIEDVISLSHSLTDSRFIDDRLYAFNNHYYLYVAFPEGYLSEDEQENYISRILEFSEESPMSIHYLMEYGQFVFKQNALKQLKNKFQIK
ncbi:adaptor protein MecA [Aquisalibacillus elongatus]|uniref:Adapter protein MecA n=1 Tax=Aquisalibacillus elongatus TaxID=485577 RepID=A0A3N5B4S2_9BACI|nr:adaptor protein MecA [Aquisalibacillus elongatus]RPF52109.1 adapter protein MecA 1/2 [Aquisalibacillus elongatus]